MSFSLAYGMEALAPAEVGIPTMRRSMLVHDPALNNQMMNDSLDSLEEERDKALLRIKTINMPRPNFTTKRSNPVIYLKAI